MNNAQQEGWRPAVVVIGDNEDRLSMAVGAHLANACSAFLSRWFDPSSSGIEVMIIVDGHKRAYEVANVITGGTDTVQTVVLYHSFLESQDLRLNVIVLDVGLESQVRPQQRLGRFNGSDVPVAAIFDEE